MKVVQRLRRWLQLYLCCDITRRYRSHGLVYYPHPIGIVIGDGTVLGQRVRIYQHVSIGRGAHDDVASYPTLGDDVWVYPGAVVSGAIRIGHRAIISANATVTCDVPDDAMVYGHNQIRLKELRPAG